MQGQLGNSQWLCWCLGICGWHGPRPCPTAGLLNSCRPPGDCPQWASVDLLRASACGVRGCRSQAREPGWLRLPGPVQREPSRGHLTAVALEQVRAGQRVPGPPWGAVEVAAFPRHRRTRWMCWNLLSLFLYPQARLLRCWNVSGLRQPRAESCFPPGSEPVQAPAGLAALSVGVCSPSAAGNRPSWPFVCWVLVLSPCGLESVADIPGPGPWWHTVELRGGGA